MISPDELVEIQVRQDELAAEIEADVKSRLIHERDAEVERVQRQGLAAVEAAQRAAAKRETMIRKEAAAAAKANFDDTLRQRLEALTEKAAQEKDLAVNAATEKHVGENLRLHAKIQELERMVERKRPQDLGDQAELDVFGLLTNLTKEFPGDIAERTAKGVPGGDIGYVVSHNGSPAGRLLLEIKNHKIWQSKWPLKLRADQIAAKAEFALIVTNAFKSGHQQMAVDNGVLVVAPARVVETVKWLRLQTIRMHVLRLSGEAKEIKAAALYQFMTGDLVRDRWERLARATDRLRDALRAERVVHEKTWGERDDLYAAISVIREEFVENLDAIFEAADIGDAA
jgi:hypothetical protein